jgi:hypothetical protein
MVRLFVRHQVADYPAWRRVYDDFDAERQTLGVTGQGVFRSVGNPNDITVWHDFPTREAADSFVSSPRLRDTMQQAGIQGAPEIWSAEEA